MILDLIILISPYLKRILIFVSVSFYFYVSEKDVILFSHIGIMACLVTVKCQSVVLFLVRLVLSNQMSKAVKNY